MALAARRKLEPHEELALTIADCDEMLRRYRRDLVLLDGDAEATAIIRFEIDRWLDRRLVLMREKARI